MKRSSFRGDHYAVCQPQEPENLIRRPPEVILKECRPCKHLILSTTPPLICCYKVKSLSRVQLFATLWTVAYHAGPSMGFSRQEYWSGLPFPSPGDSPDPGIEPGSPTLQADILPSTTHHILLVGTHSFSGAFCVPLCWQTNIAILFCFTQNSVSEI